MLVCTPALRHWSARLRRNFFAAPFILRCMELCRAFRPHDKRAVTSLRLGGVKVGSGARAPLRVRVDTETDGRGATDSEEKKGRHIWRRMGEDQGTYGLLGWVKAGMFSVSGVLRPDA